MTSRAYCFTKHFTVSDYDLPEDAVQDDQQLDLACAFYHDAADNLAGARYAILQVERGEQGRYHVQGYIELGSAVRISGVKAQFPCLADAHLEARRGSRDAARDYCRKEDTQVFGPLELGEWAAGGQGRRSDVDALVDAVREGKSNYQLAQEFPKAFMQYSGKIQSLRDALADAPVRDDGFVPRPWQRDIIDRVQEEADDRSIIWIMDSAGGKGKSRLARFLAAEHNACILSGKVADMAYMYNREPIVIFDISRAAVEHTDHLYSTAEQIKNGTLVSSKYQSTLKRFKPPHVLFFCNERPKEGKWSDDRVTIINLDTY